MRYPKLRELKEAIRALIKGPYTSRFPYKPHQPFERFRGNPKYSESDCMGCTACVNVCPSGALSFQECKDKHAAKRILSHRVDLCVFCGQCEANCPTETGIKLSRDFDLATLDKPEKLKDSIEKGLVLCECCGEAIAPYDQIAWVAKKIGPLVFSNASLMLFYLRNLNLAMKEETQKETAGQELRRSGRIKIICPRCRRQAVLKS